MKSRFTLTAIIFSMIITGWAQSPSMLWEKNYGGTQTETFSDMIKTSDGGYILLGVTESHDNDIPVNFHGGRDMFIMKINATGNIVWTRSIGGLDHEEAYSAVEDADGDIVVVGQTLSADQDFMTIPFAGGISDVVIVSLNSDGTTEWLQRYGGSGDDGPRSIQKDPAGGYIIVGYTNSPDDYNVLGMHYYGGTAETNDMWVIKLDNAGALVWQKCFGGSEDATTFGAGQEIATSVQISETGGYIVAGYTNSADGDVTNALGNNDYWILKLDNTGTMIWQKTLGGSGDDMANSMVVVADGYVIAGTTSSADMDVDDNHSFGGQDGWIVKLDFNGNIVDKHCVGGGSSDFVYGISKSSDGGFLIAGGSSSLADDCEGNYGLRDFWTLKLDANLDLVWKKNNGDNLMEEAFKVMEASDGGYIAGGYTENSALLTSGGTYGVQDWWVVKLASFAGVEEVDNQTIQVYPNPTTDKVNISGIDNPGEASYLEVINSMGQTMLQLKYVGLNTVIDLNGFAKGIYFIKINSKGKIYSKTVIVE